MPDWIDEEKAHRDVGRTRGLFQSEHAAVNARYPGCTLEYCCNCGSATGNAGPYDGSLYSDDGEGPFCEECWIVLENTKE